MVNFKPDPTYHGLRVQAFALHSLVTSYERQLSHANEKLSQLETRLKLIDESAINAERATNQILTNRLDEIELSRMDKEE